MQKRMIKRKPEKANVVNQKEKQGKNVKEKEENAGFLISKNKIEFI